MGFEKLEVVRPLSIDFHDKKYVTMNAKQYDKFSRYILISCYDQGDFFFVNKYYDAAYIRYRKADDLGVFNRCKVTDDGKIFVELTEQMLATVGTCYADLVILRKSPEIVKLDDLFDFASSDDGSGTVTLYPSDFIRMEANYDGDMYVEIKDLGEIITEGRYAILSTMTFCINVSETAFDNAEIESSYEFEALNDLLIKSTEDYTSVMTACKISEEAARLSEYESNISEENAKISEINAKTSEENAKISEENAKVSENNSKISEENSKTSENNIEILKEDIEVLNEKINTSANIATTKSEEASQYATNAYNSANAASEKATESFNSALLSQSYAIGGANVRENEDIDNAQYYYSQTKNISNSIDGSLKPMGTIEFSELQLVPKDTSYMYHISNNFVTDDTFKCGAGISCPAGTNVYYTADGYWDCFVTQTLIVTDDGDGIVEVRHSYESITTNEERDKLYQIIADLQNRIKALEEQIVLGIT